MTHLAVTVQTDRRTENITLILYAGVNVISYSQEVLEVTVEVVQILQFELCFHSLVLPPVNVYTANRSHV